MTDHPLLRAGETCVLCSARKSKGLLVCWTCYRNLNLRNGNRTVEIILDHCESSLATEGEE